MVKVQCDLSKKADAKLEKFMIYNDIPSKAEGINKILENLDLREDFKEWLKENKDNG